MAMSSFALLFSNFENIITVSVSIDKVLCITCLKWSRFANWLAFVWFSLLGEISEIKGEQFRLKCNNFKNKELAFKLLLYSNNWSEKRKRKSFFGGSLLQNKSFVACVSEFGFNKSGCLTSLMASFLCQTVHEGRIYQLKLFCDKDYPEKPPSVRFHSRINMTCVSHETGVV